MQKKDEVKLLGAWPSPFAMRVHITLTLKNIEYELLEQGMGPKTQLLLDSNPVYEQVPVMIHNGNPICESLIIIEYLDEVFTSGPSILPLDPYNRATARFWAAYIDNTWYKSMCEVIKAKSDEEKAKAVGEVTKGLMLLEEAFMKLSGGKGFFGGDKIGYIDIVFGSHLMWIDIIGKLSGNKFMDETKTQSLCGWAKRFSSDAVVKDFVPETDKLMEFAKILISALPK